MASFDQVRLASPTVLHQRRKAEIGIRPASQHHSSDSGSNRRCYIDILKWSSNWVSFLVGNSLKPRPAREDSCFFASGSWCFATKGNRSWRAAKRGFNRALCSAIPSALGPALVSANANTTHHDQIDDSSFDAVTDCKS